MKEERDGQDLKEEGEGDEEGEEERGEKIGGYDFFPLKSLSIFEATHRETDGTKIF